MTKPLSLESARSKLLWLWLIGVLLLLLPLIYQTLNKTFEKTTESGEESFAQQVWGWFIPMIFPTLTLMLSTLNINASAANIVVNVNKKTYNICFILSVFYLLLLSINVFLWPIFKYEDPIKLFNISNFYLGPIQGLAVLLIGNLFNKKE